jgi:transposase-like protein
MLKLFNIKVDHSTIWNWICKFALILARLAKLMHRNYTTMWHIDEKFIKVRGSKDGFAYLWVVADSKSKIIAVHISNKRDIASAKFVLRKAREEAGSNPALIIHDGLQAYKKACRIFGRKTRSVTAHFESKHMFFEGRPIAISNNRLERINSDIDLWLHVFRGLKSFRTAEMWLESFRIYYNWLRPSKPIVEWQKIPQIVEKQQLIISVSINHHLLTRQNPILCFLLFSRRLCMAVF